MPAQPDTEPFRTMTGAEIALRDGYPPDSWADTIEVLHAHIPSLSDENEQRLTEKVAYFAAVIFTGEPDEPDVADLAVRTCACGAYIDGFYGYVDHLTAVFGGESHFGG